MEYIKIRFGKNIHNMHTRLQRTIDDMFRQANPLVVLPAQIWRPQMDIYETPEEVIVVGDVSGVEKEDLSVEIDENAVKISGMRHEIPHVPGMKYHLAEIPYGRFERILLLPVPIDPGKAKASYTGGLLKISMAKRLNNQVRRIQIEDK